jgi:hypothetical protein
VAAPSRSSYVKPVVGQVRRLDQGIDYQGTPGNHVVAVGLARMVAIKSDPGGFGTAIYYKLLDGPARGREVYVGHAQPTVHVGQLVKAGDPVATLLDHGLGNASGLSGWTEIGFARNEAPDPGTATDFQRLVDGAGDAPVVAAAPSSPAPADGTSAAAVQPVQPQVALPTVGQDADLGVQPAPSSTEPLEPPPGSGIASTSSFAADLWNRVASQPGASADALALAQNAQMTGG